jgi:hypothetical protein
MFDASKSPRADRVVSREAREHNIFLALLEISPGLDNRIIQASADELHYVAEMVRGPPLRYLTDHF